LINKPYQCPLKGKLKCNAAFTSRLHMASHVRNVHKINYSKEFGHPYDNKGFFECPRKEEFNCSKTFTWRSSASKHAKHEHSLQLGRLPCPLKEELDCQKTFAYLESAKHHARIVHSGAGKQLQIPCPRREDQGCQRTFDTELGAAHHIARSHRVPIICLLKESCGCQETFTTQVSAETHAKTAHGYRFPCPRKTDLGCQETFTTSGGSQWHAKRIHVRQRCAIPMCRDAVSWRPMSAMAMEKHMQGHREQGHLDNLRKYHKPIPCEETKVVTIADVLQELFPELPVVDATGADSVADEEVEVFGAEDKTSSEDFEDSDDLFGHNVISVPDLNNDEESLENEESLGQRSVVHLAGMSQDEASNSGDLFFSEAGRAHTLAYNKYRIGTVFTYILMLTLIISRTV